MNYFKGKIAEKVHIPEVVETVRVQSSSQFRKYTAKIPYLNQTLPSSKMTNRQRDKLIKKIRRIAMWLDNAVPHSPIPLGIDSFLGFIPVIGGSMGGLLSLYQVYLSTTFGIPLWLFMHMLFNIVIDLVFSLIPVLGGFLHMFYKANTYNYEELNEYLDSPEFLQRVQSKEQQTATSSSSSSSSSPRGAAPSEEITWTRLGTDAWNSLVVPFIPTKKTTTSRKKQI